ncbi:uracil-DNA glycosylase [Clostridium sp. OS1-26]|uniref:uracil-DNA glycosylase n=1 Tax=Clostridium sp. OS1-26 TaxID=3070681 RepID=UPI0027E0A844|nr:uracil-DNA glycosylase [Clostridium sp. OS1-26]WML34524.1 uracil-DNA glycosylase [Clostridium sp. OS1-26]
MEGKKVQCHNCKYYYITWDIQFPYGCKLYGIKSKQVPSIIVSKSIGMPCNEFVEKTKDK